MLGSDTVSRLAEILRQGLGCQDPHNRRSPTPASSCTRRPFLGGESFARPLTSRLRCFLKQLAADCSLFVRGRVDVEIVIGRIVDNVQDLLSGTMDATRGRVSRPVEVLVVEKINPMWSVVVTRGGVEVKGGHSSVELFPGEEVTGCLPLCVEIEPSHAPPFGVSTIAELIAGQVNGEMAVAVLMHGVGLMRRCRGRLGQDKD